MKKQILAIMATLALVLSLGSAEARVTGSGRRKTSAQAAGRTRRAPAAARARTAPQATRRRRVRAPAAPAAARTARTRRGRRRAPVATRRRAARTARRGRRRAPAPRRAAPPAGPQLLTQAQFENRVGDLLGTIAAFENTVFDRETGFGSLARSALLQFEQQGHEVLRDPESQVAQLREALREQVAERLQSVYQRYMALMATLLQAIEANLNRQEEARRQREEARRRAALEAQGVEFE